MRNFINHIEGYFSSKFNLGKGIIHLIKLEAKLAGFNIVPLLISFAVLIALCFSGWLILMLLIGYILLLVVGPLPTLIIILVLNGGGLFWAVKSLLSCVKQMSFEKTREFLLKHQMKDNHELTQGSKELHQSLSE